MKPNHFLFLLLIPAFADLYPQKGQSKDTVRSPNISSKFEVSAEYLSPTRFSDKIQTVSSHAFFWKQHFKTISVLVSAGVTGTYAWGYTRRYDTRQDTIFISSHKTSAFGLGPTIVIDYVPIKIKRFSVAVEAAGCFVLYGHRFPYGGDIYNFMFRAGPSLRYQVHKNYFLKIGYRWMHVSNGKGYGRQNPFYEAQGINVGIVIVK